MVLSVSHVLAAVLKLSQSSVVPGLLVFGLGCGLYYLVKSRQLDQRATWSGLVGFTFPVSQLRSPTFRIDLVFYVVTKISRHGLLLANVAIAVLVSHVVGAGLAALFGGPALTPSIAIVALACLLAFLPRDLAHYGVHRMFHKVPLLWELHKVHHSATYLTPLTTERTHPIEDQVFALAEGLAAGLALGLLRWRYAFSDASILLIAGTTIWVARMLVLSPLQHSPVAVKFGPVDRIFYSPSLHLIHHSSLPEHWDRNFGECLSIWDTLFGSYCRYGQTEPVLGLPNGGHGRYQSLRACYLGPLANIWRLLTKGRNPSGADLEAAADSHNAPPGHALIESAAGHRVTEGQLSDLGLARID